MKDLIRLELKKVNIRPYRITAEIITIIMVGLIFLMAYISKVESKDPDVSIFADYNSLSSIFSIVVMAVFSVLAATVFSKMVIEEYAGKRTILLFTYPVKRNRIFYAKIVIVLVFTIITVLICNLISFLIFGIVNNMTHLLDDSFTIKVFLRILYMSVIMGVLSAAVGAIAMGIGFIKKSIPTTIVSAVIIDSVISNIVTNVNSRTLLALILTIIFIIGAVMVMSFVTRKVESMEV